MPWPEEGLLPQQTDGGSAPLMGAAGASLKGPERQPETPGKS